MAKKFLNNYNEDNPVLDYLAEAEAAQAQMEKIKKIKSRDIEISELQQIDELKNLFPRDENVYQKLKEDIQKDGLLAPLIVWKGKNIVVDGNTRFDIVSELGWEKVEIKELDFENTDEAVKFAELFQLDRRNFTQAQIFELSNKKIEHEYGEGRDAEIKAKMLNISPSTVKRAQFVEKYGEEEQKELIKADKATINEIAKQISMTQYIQKNATEAQKNLIEEGIADLSTVFNQIKEAEKEKKEQKKRENRQQKEDKENVSDNTENVRGLPSFEHTDGVERPDIKPYETSELDRWTKEKNIQCETARKEGYSKGFSDALFFVLGEVIKGKTAKEIYNDERISDLSPSSICNFELSPEYEDLVYGLGG